MADSVKQIRVRERRAYTVSGAVQGVGFRPFVYRTAAALSLFGEISNSSSGVAIDLEGDPAALDVFEERLQSRTPPLARIDGVLKSAKTVRGLDTLQIVGSESHGSNGALVLPDVATCRDCLSELFDPNDRRYRYPFINCTNCGPRYSIVESLPYDRCNTTMSEFELCDDCRAEYLQPTNRRFHAQPTACPVCGPHLELWDDRGSTLALHDDALLRACEFVLDGAVIALKGLGGFQLIVDASNDAAIAKLREAKKRPDKPFAIMVPDVESAESICEVSGAERDLLSSIAAPIVLCRRRPDATGIADFVAPGNAYLGVMLPYTPLHHLLMAELGRPVIATSGNRSSEPIITDEKAALQQLCGIADYYLVHNRRIARHVDDSVVGIAAGRRTTIRRARGYAPAPIKVGMDVTGIVAVGGHQKNSVAVGVGDKIFLSQHIGDLDSVKSIDAAEKALADICGIYGIEPEVVACDLHPEYASTMVARRMGLRMVRVQHHYAHVMSCMAEDGIGGSVLGVAWDGTGLGSDGTIWGGEFLRVDDSGFERLAHLRQFRLPGGDAAARDPRRCASGVLYELCNESWIERASGIGLDKPETDIIAQMLSRELNSPLTSSVGRLFDCIAAMLGLCRYSSYEGQAAIALETEAMKSDTRARYEFDLIHCGSILQLDWRPVIEGICSDKALNVSVSDVARKFHSTLVAMIVAVAKRTGDTRIALTGGCFQNRLLVSEAVTELRRSGFQPLLHCEIPPNDGGLAVGQTIAAARQLGRG